MTSVLLAEDDEFIIDIYTKKLESEGFSVVVAKDGQEAMTKIKENIFDLVLLDIVLPKFDGWQILKEIKQDERLKMTKVVILSNLGQKSEVEKGADLGATKYMIKANYSPSEMVKEIKKILK
jgi:two-component system, OmpR family, alkaline phosphatase synthesis response regulator PhoP